MSEPFIGEIRMFFGNFAPAGWALCNGQLLQIAENRTLFELIGNAYYGGNGQSTFALPDLRGRFPIHRDTRDGSTFTRGERGGAQTVALTVDQLPVHNHTLAASLNNGGVNVVTNNLTGQVSANQIYREVAPAAALNAGAMTSTGGNRPHDNMQPYFVVNYIIALYGAYPSHS